MTTMDSSGEKIASVMLKLLQSRSPYPQCVASRLYNASCAGACCMFYVVQRSIGLHRDVACCTQMLQRMPMASHWGLRFEIAKCSEWLCELP